MGAAAPVNWGVVTYAGAMGGSIGCMWTCGDACLSGGKAKEVTLAAIGGTTTGTLSGALLGSLAKTMNVENEIELEQDP